MRPPAVFPLRYAAVMEFTVTVPDWARHVVSDHTDMDRDPHPVDAAKVARFRLDLPDDVHFEYAFLDADGRMRADPGNPERADNPWFPEVSRVRGPDYRPHPLADVDPEAARGETRRLRIDDGAGGSRRVKLYTPAGASGPLPLVIVQDGTAYERIARLPAVLEALQAEGRARPARLAFVDPSRPDRRRAEYGFGEDFRRFGRERLIPSLREQAEAEDGLLLMGASLGALASTVLAFDTEAPVAGLALQSGAFLGTPRAREFHRGEGSWLLDRLERLESPLPWRVYQEVGTLDWLTDVNRAVAERFPERVARHRFETRSAGHNWTFWRDGVAEALAFLLAS